MQSPDNASGQLDRLEKEIMGLDQMPERFREYEKEPWHSRGLHIMLEDNYCVLYIPDMDKAVVTIIRVMYGGRDIETKLNKYTKSDRVDELLRYIYTESIIYCNIQMKKN